jgi:hypothetical protein
MNQRDYYDSPLYFSNAEAGKAFVEKYLGDVLFLKKKKENDYDEWFIADYYDAYDGKVSRNRKFNEDSFLNIGFADWEEIEIDPKHFNRMVIKSYIRKYMEDERDDIF